MFIFELEVQLRDDDVGKFAWRFDRRNPHEDFGRDALVQFYVLLERRFHRASQSLRFDRAFGDFRKIRHFDGKEVFAGREFFDPHAALTFNQNLYGSVGQTKKLNDGTDCSDIKDIARLGVVGLRIFLRRQHDIRLFAHRFFKSVDALFATHEQRHHHVGEDDQIPQRQKG